MSVSWWRSWHGAPTDHKWAVIANRAGVKVGIVSAVAWALMDYASQNNIRGSIKDFDTEVYAVYSGFDEQEIIAIIKAMTDKGVIGSDGMLTNWTKRQPQREDDSTERVRSWREMKRNVTQCNEEISPDIDTDIDINAANAAPPVPKREPSEKQTALKARRDALVKHFLMRTGLPAPRGDAKVHQKLWWSPLDEIYTLAGEDMQAAQQLVDKTLGRMGKLTVSDPNSIIKTARAVYAENNGGSRERAKIEAEDYYKDWEVH